MVSTARESLVASSLPHVDTKELDSEDLSSIPDNYFTHSTNNFSIFAFAHPGNAVREMYRTLRTGGLALVTCWRRFAPMFIVHAAQKKIRPGPATYAYTKSGVLRIWRTAEGSRGERLRQGQYYGR